VYHLATSLRALHAALHTPCPCERRDSPSSALPASVLRFARTGAFEDVARGAASDDRLFKCRIVRRARTCRHQFAVRGPQAPHPRALPGLNPKRSRRSSLLKLQFNRSGSPLAVLREVCRCMCMMLSWITAAERTRCQTRAPTVPVVILETRFTLEL
jgi:hypothetical protein